MSVKLNPYLNFSGNTKEVMEYYHTIFGGELKMTTFGEMGGGGMPVPEDYADKIMHAALETDDLTIMASEGMPGKPLKTGDNISLSLSGTDDNKLKKSFSALADGGQVTMPLERQMWGDEFGMCTDKFGVQWMVNITKA